MINTGNEDEKLRHPALVMWCRTILTCVCGSDKSMCEFLTVVVAVFISYVF